MTQLIENIEKQVKSCQSLLSVFQDERQLYLNKKVVGMKEVAEILNRKKRILEIFEQQQKLLMDLSAPSNPPDTGADEDRKKRLLRDLATVLEQLLVIDHENEKLLKELFSSRSSIPVKSAPPAPVRQRPALQSKLPFVPNHTPAVKPEENQSIVNKKSVAKSNMRGYLASRQMKLASKYA